MDSFSHLKISPISKDIKSPSFIDYNEQLERVTKDGQQWCWDDSRFNKARAGELFAFYFHGMRVVIHKILAVKPPSERLPSWSKNVGQGDRNVLELSAPIAEISWSEWQLIGGPESKMGTYTTGDLSCERPNLYNYLKNTVNSFTNYWKDIDFEPLVHDRNDDTLETIDAEEKNLILQMDKLREKRNKLLNKEKEKILYSIEEIDSQKIKLVYEIQTLDNKRNLLLNDIEEIDIKITNNNSNFKIL